jgi:UPF0716 protein FxsA
MLRFAVGLVTIAVPVVELGLLIKIGQHIGMAATLTMVVGAGIVGAVIISRQSTAVLHQALEAASEGKMASAPVLDGLFLILAGVLFVTPGVITDVFALALLVPPLRRGIACWSFRHGLHWSSAIVNEQAEGERAPPVPPKSRVSPSTSATRP